MSIDATPEDWDRIRQEHPAILEMDKEKTKLIYAHMAESEAADMVNSPSHYKAGNGSLECIDAIEAALTKQEIIGHYKATCIKYLWRAGSKDPSKTSEDILKCQWYLNRLAKEVSSPS